MNLPELAQMARSRLRHYDALNRCFWIRNAMAHGRRTGGEGDWAYAEYIFYRAIQSIQKDIPRVIGSHVLMRHHLG